MSNNIQTDQIETHSSRSETNNNNQSYESFKNDASSGSGDGGDTNLLDDDLDFKLPEVDWINLEAKLKEAQQEINSQNKRATFNNERDEIRRKLAIVSSSSSASSFTEQSNEHIISDYLRKTNLKNNYLGQNLQICFMNESSSDDMMENESDQKLEETRKDKQKANANHARPNSIPVSFSVFSFDPNDSCDAFIAQHLNLQNETKQALARVQAEVKRDIELEKNIVKSPSPLADIVGLPSYGIIRLEREHIVDMNIGQLQVIANDLCNQIEKINEELKMMLIDRDDFYMQQDAMLVEIEDITKRIQEYATAFQRKSNSNKETSNGKIPISSSVNAINEKVKAKADTNSTKTKLFQLNTLTNKLFRFTKK